MPPIATTLIRGIPPVFPPGFCWQNPQQYANALFEYASWRFQSDIGNSFYNWGSTMPTPENRVYPWLNTDDGLWYQYGLLGSGKWLSPYPTAPGPNGVRWEWEDTEANLQTFDGGEAAVVGLWTGPFWEIDHNYDARSSMGAVPTLPVTGSAFTQGTNLGAEQITQSEAQVGSHAHPIVGQDILTYPGTAGEAKGDSAGNSFRNGDELTTEVNQASGDVDPMTIIHPVRANYKIKRTARAWRARG